MTDIDAHRHVKIEFHGKKNTSTKHEVIVLSASGEVM